MSEELKYCKFCDKEKPIKEFCKSGGAIKNICRECQNKKQKKQYRDAKILKELEEWLKEETIELYDKDNPMLLDQSYITYATERKMAYMYILDKIQELKEKYK